MTLCTRACAQARNRSGQIVESTPPRPRRYYLARITDAGSVPCPTTNPTIAKRPVKPGLSCVPSRFDGPFVTILCLRKTGLNSSPFACAPRKFVALLVARLWCVALRNPRSLRVASPLLRARRHSATSGPETAASRDRTIRRRAARVVPPRTEQSDARVCGLEVPARSARRCLLREPRAACAGAPPSPRTLSLAKLPQRAD
jgi:hypothetical protein